MPVPEPASGVRDILPAAPPKRMVSVSIDDLKDMRHMLNRATRAVEQVEHFCEVSAKACKDEKKIFIFARNAFQQRIDQVAYGFEPLGGGR